MCDRKVLSSSVILLITYTSRLSLGVGGQTVTVMLLFVSVINTCRVVMTKSTLLVAFLGLVSNVAVWISVFALLLDSTCHNEQMCHSFWCTLAYALCICRSFTQVCDKWSNVERLLFVVVLVMTSLPFIVSSWHASVSGQSRLRHAGYAIVA